jgi:hypothetical protein
MHSTFIVERKDGGISILGVYDGSYQDAIAKWSQAKRDQVAAVRIIDPATLPQDRTFRDAWKPDLTVDMEKARDLWAEKQGIEAPTAEMQAARTPEELMAVKPSKVRV